MICNPCTSTRIGSDSGPLTSTRCRCGCMATHSAIRAAASDSSLRETQPPDSNRSTCRQRSSISSIPCTAVCMWLRRLTCSGNNSPPPGLSRFPTARRIKDKGFFSSCSNIPKKLALAASCSCLARSNNCEASTSRSSTCLACRWSWSRRARTTCCITDPNRLISSAGYRCQNVICPTPSKGSTKAIRYSVWVKNSALTIQRSRLS